MQQSYRNYFKLGINHHLLFPASFDSAEAHRVSLPEVLSYPEFEVIDLFVSEEADIAVEQIRQVRDSGRIPVYNCPLLSGPRLNPNSPDEAIRNETVAAAASHLQRAQAIGAKKAVIASGPNPGPAQIAEQTEAFVDYVAKLCAAVPELTLMIEPFDRSIGKNLLIGSTREAAEVVRRVQEAGKPNIGLLIDMGHVPLMEETFAQAVADSSSYIRHVHLGSCVKRDPADPLYGDMHPPWGYPGGENDVPELVEFLKALFASGYLGSSGERPTVTLEMRPYPGRSERESVDIFLEKLEKAWRAV
ncbi:TIM barrel protein [Paenibacillus oryzisoli]|uniref:sugar phosphate isomerase/epimerase family protein n=1 Tax=Paenibacillus oryzisoli TaxID=1850517 RepID=UPI003D2E8AC9